MWSSDSFSKNNVYPFNWRAPDTLTEILVHVWEATISSQQKKKFSSSSFFPVTEYSMRCVWERRNGVFFGGNARRNTYPHRLHIRGKINVCFSFFGNTMFMLIKDTNSSDRVFKGLNFPIFPLFFPNHIHPFENCCFLDNKIYIFWCGNGGITIHRIDIYIFSCSNVQFQYWNVIPAQSASLYFSLKKCCACDTYPYPYTCVGMDAGRSHEIYLCENEKPNSLYYFAAKTERGHTVEMSLWKKPWTFCEIALGQARPLYSLSVLKRKGEMEFNAQIHGNYLCRILCEVNIISLNKLWCLTIFYVPLHENLTRKNW